MVLFLQLRELLASLLSIRTICSHPDCPQTVPPVLSLETNLIILPSIEAFNLGLPSKGGINCSTLYIQWGL